MYYGSSFLSWSFELVEFDTIHIPWSYAVNFYALCHCVAAKLMWLPLVAKQRSLKVEVCNCVFVSQKHPFVACFKQAPSINWTTPSPSHPGVPCNGVFVCAVCAAATAPLPWDRATGGAAVGDGLWGLAACLVDVRAAACPIWIYTVPWVFTGTPGVDFLPCEKKKNYENHEFLSDCGPCNFTKETVDRR